VGRAGLAALAAALLAACSPVYVYRSAKGHASLLLHRRSIAKALKDPNTPSDLRAKLGLVEEIRAYGESRMGLAPSKDYTTYSPVKGRFVTWLVTAAPPLKLSPYLWRFPLAGSFPYKGHFREKDARAEEAYFERRGYDAYVRGVTAYNTPLWISDPLPTTALEGEPGDLADLLLHEMAHGTVYFKGQTDFDEGLASFVGDRGAAEFLAARYGAGSKEAEGYSEDERRRRRFDAEMDGLRERLTRLYASTAPAGAMMDAREQEFSAAKERFAALGVRFAKLNNAVVVAHGVYRENSAVYEKAFEKSGRDWAAFWALMRSLDKKRPREHLEEKLAAGYTR
jgi:predicted aminopeptidase